MWHEHLLDPANTCRKTPACKLALPERTPPCVATTRHLKLTNLVKPQQLKKSVCKEQIVWLPAFKNTGLERFWNNYRMWWAFVLIYTFYMTLIDFACTILLTCAHLPPRQPCRAIHAQSTNSTRVVQRRNMAINRLKSNQIGFCRLLSLKTRSLRTLGLPVTRSLLGWV